MNKEYKAFEFKVSEADESGDVGYIEGYASTFGNVDLGDDIVERGAFKRSIKDKRGVFPILLDHDPSKPIGWNVEAAEDNVGLKVKGEIQLETEEARNRFKLAKRAKDLGTKMGLSIGYRTITGEPDRDRPSVRRLKEVKLYEYSFVTFPMNEMAGIGNTKSAAILRLFETLQSKNYDLEKLEKALAFLKQQEEPPATQPADPEQFAHSVDKLIQRMLG